MDIKSAIPEFLDKLLLSGQVEGESRIIQLQGASTRNNLFQIAACLDDIQPLKSLEIGLATGISALLITHWYKTNMAKAKAQHIALDPFQSDLDNAGLRQIKDAELSGYFQHIPKCSYQALPEMLENNERFQFIYIDGSHLFEDVFIDIFYGARLLDEGGVLLLDDATWPDVRKVINFIRRNMSDSLEEVDMLNYRQIEKRTLKYKVGRKLGKVQMVGFRKKSDPTRSWDSKLVEF